ALQRVVAEYLPAHGGEPIDALAEIDRGRGHKDPALGGQLQHERPSTKARTSASSGKVASAPGMHSRVPSARDSSIWSAPVGGGQEGAAGTSTKPKALGGADAAGGSVICFFRSVKRNRNCLATRGGGKTEASATA